MPLAGLVALPSGEMVEGTLDPDDTFHACQHAIIDPGLSSHAHAIGLVDSEERDILW